MIKLFCIISILLSTVNAFSATLNVNSATGSDSNTYAQVAAGTHQWATLGRAMWGNAIRSSPNASEAATAGDTVLVAAGTYTAPDTGISYTPAFNPVNSGSSGNRITIRAVGTVNLSTTGTSGGPVIGADNGKHYITWDGFTVDETGYTSLESGEQSIVVFHTSNYGTVQNCTLIGRTTAYDDGNHAAIFFSSVSNGYAYNNSIRDSKGPGSNNAAIYTYETTDSIFEHNYIYNCTGGIFVKSATNSNILIRYNKINTVSDGIHLGANAGANTNIIAYQNIIYNATGTAFITWTNVSTGCKIVNNTMYNVGVAFTYNFEDDEVLIYNNIVHTATIVVNSMPYPEVLPTVHDWQHNCYYSWGHFYAWDFGGFKDWTYWTSTANQDTVSPAGITGSDPLFVSIPSLNFKLQGGSPAAALGVDILDLDGDSSTSDNIPAGAYVTGNETIGIESTGTTQTIPGGVDLKGASLQ